jgi:hypothetical protein
MVSDHIGHAYNAILNALQRRYERRQRELQQMRARGRKDCAEAVGRYDEARLMLNAAKAEESAARRQAKSEGR